MRLEFCRKIITLWNSRIFKIKFKLQQTIEPPKWTNAIQRLAGPPCSREEAPTASRTLLPPSLLPWTSSLKRRLRSKTNNTTLTLSKASPELLAKSRKRPTVPASTGSPSQPTPLAMVRTPSPPATFSPLSTNQREVLSSREESRTSTFQKSSRHNTKKFKM